MTREDPKARPTAVEALQQFEGMVKRQPVHVVLWKLKSVESNLIMHAYQNIISLGVVSAVYAKTSVCVLLIRNTWSGVFVEFFDMGLRFMLCIAMFDAD